MNEDLLLSDLYFLQDSYDDKFHEIARGCLTLGNLFVDDVADPAEGLLEDDALQLAGMGLRKLVTNELGGVLRKAPDGGNLGAGPASGFFYRAVHVQQPGFPSLFTGDIEQQAVVVGSMSDDAR